MTVLTVLEVMLATLTGVGVLILIASFATAMFTLVAALRWYFVVVPIVLWVAYLVGTAVIGGPL